MILSEAEAKKLRCVDGDRNCVAAFCMAWRWSGADPSKPDSGGVLLPRELWPGYCGKAGKP